MEQCPKCKCNGVFGEYDFGQLINKCYSCGFSHIPGASMQSFEKQVTGKNDRFGKGDAAAQLKGCRNGFSEGMAGVDDMMEYEINTRALEGTKRQ